MRKIVECVPNFSEGKDAAKIREIVQAVTSVPGIMLLDTHSDADHHRSVLTFAGEPEAVLEAAFLSARKAVELIDLNEHLGEHPRIGAIDVLPFIPLEGVSMSECIALARRAGERIATELEVPVYLYDKAAQRPECNNLAHIRRGQFEGLRREILVDPERHPDFGEPRLHATAGAVAVGARKILVAFNINLATDDLEVAKNIAAAVRGRDGGLRYVKALGFSLHDRRQTQVSMNLVDVEKTPIFRAYEMVEREATRYGVNISGSEIVGLVPQAALNACSTRYLRLQSSGSDRVLETRLQHARRVSENGSDPSSSAPDAYIDDVARGTAVPGGGSVAALAGTLAAALGSMTCHLALSSHDAGSSETEVQELLEELDDLRAELRRDIEADSESFTRVIAARHLPHRTEAERLQRTAAIEQAIKGATAVPLRVAESSLAVLELLDELAELTKPARLPEVAVGAQMALAAIRGATYTILANLGALGDEESTRQTNRELEDLINRGQEIADEIESLLRSKV